MSFKDQLIKLKNNWLLIVLVVVILGVFMFGGTGAQLASRGYVGYDVMETAAAPKIAGGYYPYYEEDFAPEVEERLITKIASLSTEVKRGTFNNAASKLKAIITSSDSFLLNEDVNKYGSGIRQYYRGSYQIKVEAEKYDSVISQLKDIGEVQSFSENALDVTGRYTNLQIELEAEKARLQRYQEMYDEAVDISDKIELSDKIFNQERTIKYYEDAIENIDKRVEYSTVYVTITEKQSEYMNVVFVKFSALVKSLVNSINALLSLIFILLPWAALLVVILVLIRVFRKNKKR